MSAPPYRHPLINGIAKIFKVNMCLFTVGLNVHAIFRKILEVLLTVAVSDHITF